MTKARLRVGIVGANAARGWARDAHVPALRSMADFTIHAVSARTQDIADEAATAFGAARAYGDSLALVRDPEIDIVAVCVKVPEHRAIVLAALDAGKHIYCEWPLGRDTAEAEELAAAARDKNLHVAIGLQGAEAVAVREAARLVREGVIGHPLSLNVISPTGGWGSESPAFYAYLQDKSNGATLLSIPGGHTMAAIDAVLGDYRDVSATGHIFCPQVDVSGTGNTLRRSGFDHLVVVGRHASGAVSTLEIVGGTMSTPFRFALRGSAGTLIITGGHPGGYQAGQLLVTTDTGAPSPEAPPMAGLSGPPVNVAALYARFGADIRRGAHTVPNFDAAVRLHRLLDAVETAAEDGRRVAL